MAAKDLITTARAKQDIQAITDSSQDALIATLITACSDAIEKYCRRDFNAKSYDELYNGTGDHRLLLRQYPIQLVKSVRYRPVTVLKVTNTNPANVQARVAVTSIGLTLTRVDAGVTDTDTSVTFAGNATLAAAAASINALGKSWFAQVVGDATNYGSWPFADLYVPPSFGDGASSQGALQCVAGSFAELKMHTYELAGYQFDPRGWLLRAIPYSDPELLDPDELTFPAGVNNFRVQYTAGYTTVPESVQEACAQWVAELWYQTKRDPAVLTTSVVGTTSASYNPALTTDAPPPRVKALLAPYRRRSIDTSNG